MKLIVQPRDGFAEILTGIRSAKKEIDVLIFRFDRSEVEKALEAAVKRGVKVRALIAHTNKGGEKYLRKLEQRLLEAGASVARTGDEFVRYHGKYMVVDRRSLYLLGFNFTLLDTAGSRSFGIVTRQRTQVLEALKLFEADRARQPFEIAGERLIVSPENARTALGDFIRKAKKQLFVYDPKVSDVMLSRLLKDRVKHGVDVRIIGRVGKAAQEIPHEKYPGKRLHVRAMIRDGRAAFIGSQSMRKLELDNRREVGIFIKNATVVNELARTFEDDWSLTDSGRRAQKDENAPAEAVAYPQAV